MSVRARLVAVYPETVEDYLDETFDPPQWSGDISPEERVVLWEDDWDCDLPASLEEWGERLEECFPEDDYIEAQILINGGWIAVAYY